MQQKTCSTVRDIGFATRCASSLVTYAQQHPGFAPFLLGAIRAYGFTEAQEVRQPMAHRGLTYRSTDDAARQALWLCDALLERRLRGSQTAQAILASYLQSRDADERSFVVLGLQYGVLNYGVIGHPKRPAEPMAIVVRDTFVARAPLHIYSTTITQLSHEVVERGLIEAGGQTAKLEPTLGNWLFGERPLALYRGGDESLAYLSRAAHTTGAPYAQRMNGAHIEALALSPVLDITDLPGYDALTSLVEAQS